MRLNLICYLFLFTLIYSCRQENKTAGSLIKDSTHSISIDSAFGDMVKSQLRSISNRKFSSFETDLEARYFANNSQVDSFIGNYEMMSWYHVHGDTIDLVAHINDFESEALLLHFVGNKTIVKFFRASHGHEGSYLKENQSDSLSHLIEVNPVFYKLKLSQIPDTLTKPIVYGYIDMKSGNYYDSRDTTGKTHQIQMKFYFQSQYRHFDY